VSGDDDGLDGSIQPPAPMNEHVLLGLSQLQASYAACRDRNLPHAVRRVYALPDRRSPSQIVLYYAMDNGMSGFQDVM
jgi:hypothetical protein